MDEDLKTVRASYGRIIGRRGFTERFYELFLASRPEIAKMFETTDFKKQREKLTKAISMSILFPYGDEISIDALNRIRESHNHQHMDIKPEYYIHWANSLVATIAEFDPQFNDEVEDCWRRSIQTSLKHIKEGYSNRSNDCLPTDRQQKN